MKQTLVLSSLFALLVVVFFACQDHSLGPGTGPGGPTGPGSGTGVTGPGNGTANMGNGSGTGVALASSLTVTAIMSTTTGTNTSCGSATGVAKLVCLAEAFKATLNSTQISTVQRTYSKTDAETWSNLPAADVPRLGVNLGSLSTTQLAALRDLMIAALVLNVTNEGYDELLGDLVADNYLATISGTTYGAGNFYLTFLGTPSTTGLWAILFTGHHYTQSYTFNVGQITGVTPVFRGVEPMAPVSSTVTNRTYQPMEQERQVFATLLTGLSNNEQTTAKLASTFSDLVVGPGKDGQFPATKVGVSVGSLSADKQALVLNAIKLYVNDLDPSLAAGFLAKYTAELANTYVAYSGTTSVTAENDYIRLDGPSVWIEFSYQHGAVIQGAPHPHSVWRDHTSDYGGN